VELTLFGNNDRDEQWQYAPLHPANNIQGEGPAGTNSFLIFQTLQNKPLVRRQELLVQKLLEELNAFDNLYYEICNEPYNEVKDSAAVDAWHNHLVDFIRKTEKRLPKKHLIASNQAVVDHPGVSVANYHYVKIPHMPSFTWLYRLNKVIGLDETLGSLVDSGINDVRVEAWDCILKGNGVYNNLSWEYIPGQPAGTAGAATIRTQLAQLQKFMAGFNYVKMKPAENIIKTVPDSAFVKALSEPGKQYALYLHHSAAKGKDAIWGYKARVKEFTNKLTLEIPRGTYQLTWVEPATGKTLGGTKDLSHPGGTLSLSTPAFITDIAMRLTRK